MTKIEWTDETWNPVVGCTKVSEGCRNCYAERMAYRLMAMERGRIESELGGKYSQVVSRLGGWNGKICCDKSALNIPLHWRKPRQIFVCSMGDLFHPKVPNDIISIVFDTINHARQHTYQILTKHPERAKEYFGNSKTWSAKEWPNVWLGVTCENQKCADERIPILLSIPAAHRFVSFEPMLEQIDLPFGYSDIDWAIIGCESGPKRRPCKLEWVNRLVINQLKFSSIPVFVKQLSINGKVSHNRDEWPEDLRYGELPY